MKYVTEAPGGGWDLEPYFRYLSQVRERLPQEVYRFAADPSHYDLVSHQSLHDAWLESLTIAEPSSGKRSEVRGVQIDSCYLGPFHDLRIHLRYLDVAAYELVTPVGFAAVPATAVGHGDLLMHEVRLADTAGVVHELVFSRGSTFRITCKTISHWVEPCG